jgi:hypothetical protein
MLLKILLRGLRMYIIAVSSTDVANDMVQRPKKRIGERKASYMDCKL